MHTIFEAFILVFIIVFIFLQDLRSTIIPAIAIPVSLIGTMFFLLVYGFSINILTMFALVLAIGIVVDDAIVVVEAIHQKMELTNLSAKNATLATMKEITPAILSITMVMAAVFLPIGFMEGPTGLFYRQFAYTMATAILLSALCALTLSPALSALILKKPNHEHRRELAGLSKAQIGEKDRKTKTKAVVFRFFDYFNEGLQKLTQKYISCVKWLISKKPFAFAALILVVLIGFLLMRTTPTAFIPNEDDGFITYTIKMPPGATLARTTEVLNKAESILKRHKEIKTMTSIAGYNAIDAATSSAYAVGYLNMYPHSQRKGIKDINEFMDTIRKDLSKINEASFSVFPRPTVQGFGDVAGLQFVLEDRLGGSFQQFGHVSDSFIKALENRPEVLSASTPFQANFPQYVMDINYVKAKALGVSVKDMMTTIRDYFGRAQASDFTSFGRQYRVYVQSDFQYRKTPESFKSIYIKNDKGQMVPANTLITLEKNVGPEVVNRYNLFNSISINATPAKGYSTGDAMNAVEEVAKQTLPGNYQLEWTGMSLDEKSSSGQTAFILLLSVLFVYFLLSGQYESYIMPFAILLSIPVGLVGVYGAVKLVGLQNNIYVQLGLIMLIGLLAKNAILMVEYSMQRRKAGMSIYDAAIQGATLRLRPILMTSLAFVAGLIPLMWTQGPSAQGNHSISYGAAGGMVMGVLLGIFIIPVLFIIFRTLDEKLKLKFQRNED
jgi:HAE1 family hydrophobic/amphiphilic exporter-1